MNGFRDAITRYASFSGRSSRGEFWGFVLVVFVISVVLGLVFAGALAVGGGSGTLLLWCAWTVTVVVALALLVPWLALGWRRFQDIGLSGAVSIIGWVFPVVTLVAGLLPGQAGANDYGPDPAGQD